MKYLLILIVVLNTSFIELKHKYWCAVVWYRSGPNDNIYVNVIDAPTEQKALVLMDNSVTKHNPVGKKVKVDIKPVTRESILR